jgi:hypothetical protein
LTCGRRSDGRRRAPEAPAVNHTVRRLLALEPGDSFTFYRGALPDDVNHNSKAPQYAAVIAAVYATAHQLQKAGRIAVTERKVELTTADGKPFSVTEYRALGLAPRADGDEVVRDFTDEAAAT